MARGVHIGRRMKLLAIAFVAACATSATPPVTNAGPAAADALLSPAELEQIARGLRDRLPPVDRAVAATCQAEVDAYNHDPEAADASLHLGASASCYYEAGAIGAAIRIWANLIETDPGSPAAEDAALRRARAYEHIGFFRDAAQAHAQIAAPGHHQRAMCLYRELGDAADAERLRLALSPAERAQPCDVIRTIATRAVR